MQVAVVLEEVQMPPGLVGKVMGRADLARAPAGYATLSMKLPVGPTTGYLKGSTHRKTKRRAP